MKKLIVFFLMAFAISSITQAQLHPISAATPVMVKTFEIDTVKAGVTDSLCIFYVPYSMNVIGLIVTAQTVDSTSNTGLAPGNVITLYRFTPSTNIAGATIATAKLCTSNIVASEAASPLTSALGHLVIGAYYKLKIAITSAGHVYRLRMEVHYTR
jgi:hypothetical protein